jgi:hypothetical protein
MPVIQTYEQQVLPQGQFNVQATPEQMGAGIGRAISDLGDTFTKIEQDKGEVWAYKTSNDEYEKLRQRFDEDMNGLDPNDPEFNVKLGNMTSNFQAQIDKTTSDLVANAPSSFAARAIETQMIGNKRNLLGYAAGQQSRVVGEQMKSQLDASAREDLNSLARDPSDENFDRLLTARKIMVGKLNSVSPEKKLEWMNSIQRDFAVVQATTLARKYPERFLKSINVEGGKIAVPRGDGTSFGDSMAFILSEEGGYVEKDGVSGAPANFGINQKYNPDIDVKNLTQDRAVQLYKERYWNAIDGDNLPKGLATVAFNVAVNQGVSAAKDLLAKSNGDPAAFTTLAKQRYVAIAANNPAQEKYLNGWLARADKALAAATAPRNTLPQVQMLPDEAIVSAKPSFSGAQYLYPQDVQSATRIAEGELSQKLSLEQAELSNTLKDVEAVLSDGKDFPGINDGRFTRENLVRVFGPQKGKDYYEGVEKLKQISPIISTLSKMKNSEVTAALKQFEPKEGPGYADDKKVYNSLRNLVVDMQQKRKEDYMAWALNQDNSNAKPIDWESPDKLRESLVARKAIAVNARIAHGIAAPPLSKEEAAQFSDRIKRGTAADAVGIIKTMKAAFRGDDGLYIDAMTQIGERLPNFAYAGNIAIRKGSVNTGVGTLSAEAVTEKIVSGSFILGNNGVNEKDKTPSPVKIDQTKFRAAFDSVVDKRAFALPDEKQSAQMLSQTLGAVQSYVAARIMEDGGVAPDNYTAYVKEAVKAVTGGTISYARNSTIFLPWGLDQNTFESVMPAAVKEAITNNPPLIPTPMNAGHMAFGNGYADGEYIILNPLTRQAIPGKNGAIVVKVKHSDNRVINAKAGGSLPYGIQGLYTRGITDGN